MVLPGGFFGGFREVAEAFEDGGAEEGKGFADGTGVAGQVDEEGLTANTGGGAGQNTRGDLGEVVRGQSPN
jgi:hypothetical protein